MSENQERNNIVLKAIAAGVNIEGMTQSEFKDKFFQPWVSNSKIAQFKMMYDQKCREASLTEIKCDLSENPVINLASMIDQCIKFSEERHNLTKEDVDRALSMFITGNKNV